MIEREYCKLCGDHIMTNHQIFRLIDVFSATIPSLNHKPALHVNYSETVSPIVGLPKFADFPAEFGKLGHLIVEWPARCVGVPGPPIPRQAVTNERCKRSARRAVTFYS